MTWFPDLSPYAYGDAAAPPAPDGDVNVGWLSAEHPFPTSVASPALVDALLRCALWPVRMYRGFHSCDLCAEESFGWIADLDGRAVHLGNGEIRVRGADGRWYAAPTLVAHYVAEHGYAPPAAFVAAVLAHARALPAVTGARLGRLAQLDERARFDRCLSVLAALVARLERPELRGSIERIRALAPALERDRSLDTRRAAYDAVQAFERGPDATAEAASTIARRTAAFFERLPDDAAARDDDTLQNLARVIELAEAVGVTVAAD